MIKFFLLTFMIFQIHTMNENELRLDLLEGSCSICLDNYSHPVKLHDAGEEYGEHYMCLSCLNNFIKDKDEGCCPKCRCALEIYNLKIYIRENNQELRLEIARENGLNREVMENYERRRYGSRICCGKFVECIQQIKTSIRLWFSEENRCDNHTLYVRIAGGSVVVYNVVLWEGHFEGSLLLIPGMYGLFIWINYILMKQKVMRGRYGTLFAVLTFFSQEIYFMIQPLIQHSEHHYNPIYSYLSHWAGLILGLSIFKIVEYFRPQN